MRRHLLCKGLLGAVSVCALSACGGSSAHGSGTTATTDAHAYAYAYTVCLQLRNTDAARNATPQTVTDDQADAIFAGLALQLKPASERDPKAWGKLQRIADRLRQQLADTSSTDDQIESSITKMIQACTAATRRPATPTTSISPASSSSTTSTAP